MSNFSLTKRGTTVGMGGTQSSQIGILQDLAVHLFVFAPSTNCTG
jgi:hypothetical protein